MPDPKIMVITTIIENCALGHHVLCPKEKVFQDGTIICTCPCHSMLSTRRMNEEGG